MRSNVHGFSLIQTMMAMAVAGVLSLTIAELMVNTSKASSYAWSSSELQDLTSRIQLLFDKPTYCELGSGNPEEPLVFDAQKILDGEKLAISEIRTKNGEAIAKVGQKVRAWSIKGINIDKITTGNVGDKEFQVDVSMDFEREGQGFGPRSRRKSVPVDIVIDAANVISGCGKGIRGLASDPDPNGDGGSELPPGSLPAGECFIVPLGRHQTSSVFPGFYQAGSVEGSGGDKATTAMPIFCRSTDAPAVPDGNYLSLEEIQSILKDPAKCNQMNAEMRDVNNSRLQISCGNGTVNNSVRSGKWPAAPEILEIKGAGSMISLTSPFGRNTTINGSGFQPGAQVSLANGTQGMATIDSVTFVSSKQLRIRVSGTMPAFVISTWDVSVKNPDGEMATKAGILRVRR